MLPRFAAFDGASAVLTKNHCLQWPLKDPTPGAVHYLAPRSKSGDAVCDLGRPSFYLPSTNSSFCGSAVDPSDGTVYALVETHDISQFPDPDCQNLSGTVEKTKVVSIKEGIMTELADVPGGGQLSGSPHMFQDGVWLVQRGGGLYAFNTTAGTWTGDDGSCEKIRDFPTLLP